MTNKVTIKRAYEPADREDGFRVLVDRIWPRGVSRSTLKIDLWMKEIAPSTELRKWFNHDVAKWDEFQNRYRKELQAAGEQLDCLKKHLSDGPLTLVYGARDEQHNQAVVLCEVLREALR